MAKKPSVLICTPAFGGNITYHYAGSLMDTTFYAAASGLQLAAHFLANESLISRARNRCADVFLRSKFDKLLFIDADIAWTRQDFLNLYSSDKPLIGGTYPGKMFPIELMMNALTEHGHIFDHRARTTEQLEELGKTYGDKRGQVEVRHIPTGFMMIDRKVLEGLKPHVKKYWTHTLGTKEEIEMHDFFPSGVNDQNQYESEDWAFCSSVRKHLPSMGVWLHSKVVLPHTGTYTFRAGHV